MPGELGASEEPPAKHWERPFPLDPPNPAESEPKIIFHTTAMCTFGDIGLDQGDLDIIQHVTHSLR